MTIHIKDPAVARLAAELASLTGDCRTEAIRKALEEKIARLACNAAHRIRRAELVRILGREVSTPARAGGKPGALTPSEVQELLAYGP